MSCTARSCTAWLYPRQAAGLALAGQLIKDQAGHLVLAPGGGARLARR
ncbi:hypothetical protein UFOVP99_1, partial [uncultured Caudovirales phage]